MNTKELHSLNLGLHYKGCFSSDKLPHVDRSPFAVITNTDPLNLPGTHWVAIFIENRRGEYFDPSGRYPNTRIQKWLNRNCLEWGYNKKQIQQPYTETCGLYCVYFVKERPVRRHRVLNIFGENLERNEMVIKDYVRLGKI